MGAPLEICSKRSVVAVLASGLVISLTALTGGIAPAFAKPGTDPSVTTTTVPAPEPKAQATEETEAPSAEAPPKAPAPPAPPAAPVAPVTPTTTVNPPAPAVDSAAPHVAAPPTSQAPSVTSTTTTAQSPATQAPSAPSAAATTSASPTASVAPVPPSEALVAPSSATGEAPPTSSAATTPSTASAAPTTTGSSTVSHAAKVIEKSEPQTLQAPKEDVELARNAEPVEAKPDPAPKQDVEDISASIGFKMGGKGPLGVDASAKADVRLDGEHDPDRHIRQWSPDWVQYDEYYRPIVVNPYRERVRIVYVYDNAPRIVWIPPLERAVLDVAQFAAYSFTAVVDTAANIVNAAVDTAADVAVGSFFGGGYAPAFGQPLPPPPPPVLRYDNVPVEVRYSQATYEPFRVGQVIDVGDDPRYGEREVLLDGATPAWGEWTQTPSGERQFEVHKTQQFPGLGDPQEAPLPGDYNLRLASAESPSGPSGKDVVLYVAAGVTVTLGLGAIALALFLGRRRSQH
ncbi:MAG: hypothetical protein QOC63_4386 [Mycobacterium sp.]|nr:hypothetical protein [Mycobacterium sp.]